MEPAAAAPVGTPSASFVAPSASSGPGPGQNGVNTDPEIAAKVAAAAVRAHDVERQEKLVADSDKLLALATQLHADVARTDKNILSIDVLHRADQIEKLAHDLKQRMKAN